MEEKIENKRKFPRAIFCTEAELETDAGCFHAFTHNLTPEGIYIKADRSMSMGQRLVVSFCLPESQEMIKAEGSVVRLLSDGFGVRFDSPLPPLMAVPA